jgi:hypothetical protein
MMYPDIMDAVISGVCPAGSLVLRATSRELRARVDNELWRHIALGPSDDGMGITVAAAGGRMPLRIRHCGHTSHPTDCTFASPPSNEIFPALLDRARVVSITGPVDAYGGSLAWFSGKLRHIETLRLLPPMPRPFTIWPDTVRGVRAVIIFTVMTRGSRHFLDTPDTHDPPPMLYKPPFAPIPPVTSSAARLVLNVAFHPDDPFGTDARLGPVPFAAKLDELVIIFMPADAPDERPDLGSPFRRPLRRPALGILHPVITSMLGSRKTKVTIVDAALLGPHALGLPVDFDGDVYDELLGIAAQIFLTQGVGFETDTTKYLEFLTLAQYAATLDEDEFELETRE